MGGNRWPRAVVPQPVRSRVDLCRHQARHRPAAQPVTDQPQQLRPDRERRRPRRLPGQQRVPGQRRPPRPGHQLPDDPVLQIGLGRIPPRPPGGQPRLRQGTPGQRRLPGPRLALDGDQPRLPAPHPGQHHTRGHHGAAGIPQPRRPPAPPAAARPRVPPKGRHTTGQATQRHR